MRQLLSIPTPLDPYISGGYSWPCMLPPALCTRLVLTRRWTLLETLACTAGCRVEMIGAKPMVETFGGGDCAFKEEDQNVKGVVWSVRVWWEAGGVLCSEKVSSQQNKGRPITVRRWIDQTGELIVTQKWAPGKVFTQRLVRAGPGAAS